jgi:hypothetical protein
MRVKGSRKVDMGRGYGGGESKTGDREEGIG